MVIFKNQTIFFSKNQTISKKNPLIKYEWVWEEKF